MTEGGWFDEVPEEPAYLESNHPPLRGVPGGLPTNQESEKAVLGAYLLGLAGDVELERAHFTHPFHSRIWGVIKDLRERRVPADISVVRAELKDLVPVEYLMALQDAASRATNLEFHARKIREVARKRELIAKASSLIDTLGQTTCDYETVEEMLRDVSQAWYEEGETDGQPIDLLSALAAPELPRWRVRHLIPERGLALVWGLPGSFKSTVVMRAVLDLVAEPQPEWAFGSHELRIDSSTRSVLWLDGENGTGLTRYRVDALRAGEHVEVRNGSFLYLDVMSSQKPISLLDVPELLERHKPSVIVADPLVALFPRTYKGEPCSLDRDNDAVRAILGRARAACVEAGATLICIHHPSKAGGSYRGASDLGGVTDVELAIEPVMGLDGRIQVTTGKLRGGKKLQPFNLDVGWNGGACTIRRVDGSEELNLSGQGLVVRNALENMTRATPAEISTVTNVPPSTVRRVFEALEKAGVVRNTGKTVRRSPVYEMS